METSQSIFHLGIYCLPRNYRNHSRSRTDILQTNRRSLLPVRFRLLPVRLLLRVLLDLRYLLVRPLALLALEVGLLTPILGLGLRRPRLLHPQRTIRTGRDHKGPVRSVDARSTNAQPTSLIGKDRAESYRVPPRFFECRV
jgi:hypothetical protein